jgi:hypothetical protein
MANNAKSIAAQFIGEARRNPRMAPTILRRAAATFAGAATDPRNQHIQQKLTAIGLDFAGAAAQAAEKQASQSDFRTLLEQTAAAWDEIGPEAAMMASGALDATAQQRSDVATQALAENAVSIQPASFLNKDATLGRSATVTFNPSPDQIQQNILSSQTVAFWQGAKKESQAMTVDIGTVIPGVEVSSNNRFVSAVSARPFAILQYGADGNTQNSIPVDVGLGRRITVVGNYISVVVGMDPPRPRVGRVFFSPAVLTIGASIGTFAAESQAPVIRSLYFDTLVAGAFSDAVPLPLRATYLLPPMGASTTDTLTVRFLDVSKELIGEFAYTFSPVGPFMTPYPVPASAYWVAVKSATGVGSSGTNSVIVPFQLSL